MSPTPDIENMIRQKQLMDQITNQGTGSAMMGGGANLGQFNSAGAGQGADYTGLPAKGSGGGGGLGSLIPGVSQLRAGRDMIENKIASALTPKEAPDPGAHTMTYEQAQGPEGPKLMQGGAPYQPQLQIGQGGQLTIAGSANQPQFTPIPGRYTPFTGQ